MKTTALLVTILSIGALSAAAQDPKGAQALGQAQAVTKETPKKPAVAPQKPGNEVLGKPVTYGGFLTDLARAENKRAFFSLKKPVDPVKDLENIWFYPGTQIPQGVVLFSVKF